MLTPALVTKLALAAAAEVSVTEASLDWWLQVRRLSHRATKAQKLNTGSSSRWGWLALEQRRKGAGQSEAAGGPSSAAHIRSCSGSLQ